MLTPDEVEVIADTWLNSESLSVGLRDGSLPSLPVIFDLIKKDLQFLCAVGIHREGQA